MVNYDKQQKKFMISRRFARTASLTLAAGLFVAGFWPLGFSPRNRVSPASEGRGLYFDGTKSSLRLSVGGLAYSDSVPGKAHAPDAAKGSLTILIRLRPGQENGGSVPRIVSWAEASGREALYLGQYKENLIVRWFAAKPGGGTTPLEIGVGGTLIKSKTRRLAITSDQKETIIYADGRRTRRVPGAALLAGERSIPDYRIFLGNTPQADSPWTGAILDLALYDRPLGEDEIFEDWRRSSDRLGDPDPVRDGLTAAYKFETGESGRVSDFSGNGNDIIVPARIRINNKVLEWPDLNSESVASLAKDMIANILGFIPFGFVFLLWLDDEKRRPRRRSYLFVIALGAFFSLAIEVTQAFMPARDSSLSDLICNILGTMLGVLAYHYYSRFMNRRISEN